MSPPDGLQYQRVRVVCLRGDELLLVRHRWIDGSYFWMLPGGGIKTGESLNEAAVREVWEEAGVRVRIVRRLDRPAHLTAVGPEHAFVLAEPLDAETRGPQATPDGDHVFAVEWHAVTEDRPVGGLTPELWAPLAGLLRELMRDSLSEPRPQPWCWVDPRITARPSRIEGSGLFATAAITKGEAVAMLGGRVIDDAELGEIARSRSKYSSVAIAEGLNLLLEESELLARGNHSCDPNLWMRDALTLEASRDVAVGEELTVDYALHTALEDWSMTCRCGTPACRGVVRGSDWERPDLQERYRGHFSPFLERRINAMRSGRPI